MEIGYDMKTKVLMMLCQYNKKKIYDEVFEIIKRFESLSSYGKYFKNIEIYDYY